MIQVLIGEGKLGVDVLQVPLEGLAVEPLPDGQPVADVPIISVPHIRSLGVVVFFVFIHPGFSETQVVVDEDLVHPTRERVRLSLAKDMTDS